MSQEREPTDDKMSKVIESLNLHKLLPEICNVSSVELKNSLVFLGDKVIVGKFSVEPTVKGDSEATDAAAQSAETVSFH